MESKIYIKDFFRKLEWLNSDKPNREMKSWGTWIKNPTFASIVHIFYFILYG